MLAAHGRGCYRVSSNDSIALWCLYTNNLFDIYSIHSFHRRSSVSTECRQNRGALESLPKTLTWKDFSTNEFSALCISWGKQSLRPISMIQCALATQNADKESGNYTSPAESGRTLLEPSLNSDLQLRTPHFEASLALTTTARRWDLF